MRGKCFASLQELATERQEHTFWRKVLDTSVSEAERQSEPQIHDDSMIHAKNRDPENCFQHVCLRFNLRLNAKDHFDGSREMCCAV